MCLSIFANTLKLYVACSASYFSPIWFIHKIVTFDLLFGYILIKIHWCFEEIEKTKINCPNHYELLFLTISWLLFLTLKSCTNMMGNSILLHSSLNPAWHFWLSTRFSCCLKMKSVLKILGYFLEQFQRFSQGLVSKIP